MIIEYRTGGTVPGAVLPVTGQPYVEALNRRRYDLGGNVQWLLAGRYALAARFSALDQEHTHSSAGTWNATGMNCCW